MARPNNWVREADPKCGCRGTGMVTGPVDALRDQQYCPSCYPELEGFFVFDAVNPYLGIVAQLRRLDVLEQKFQELKELLEDLDADV